MKSLGLFLILFSLFLQNAPAQEFDKSLNKDSLLKKLLTGISAAKKKEILEQYNSGNEQTKEFLLFMLAMPRSSKHELINNINVNYKKVLFLKEEYKKLVPKNGVVRIEFSPENKLIKTKASIDMMIELTEHGGTEVKQDWNLEYHSSKLNKMLALIHWDYKILEKIKGLLADAHCISVENRREFEIGFARSGMGEYSYLLLDKDIPTSKIKGYNNGCSLIFYKKNIVLKYDGGAAGPQCFPDTSN